MLSYLYFRPSTYKTLFMEVGEGIPTLRIPEIFPLPMPLRQLLLLHVALGLGT